MYGNNYQDSPEIARFFPFIMSHLSPEFFEFKKCTFGKSYGKEGTGRVVLWKLLDIPAVFTLEASLCGG